MRSLNLIAVDYEQELMTLVNKYNYIPISVIALITDKVNNILQQALKDVIEKEMQEGDKEDVTS